MPDGQRDQIRIVEDPELQLMDLHNQMQSTRKIVETGVITSGQKFWKTELEASVLP